MKTQKTTVQVRFEKEAKALQKNRKKGVKNFLSCAIFLLGCVVFSFGAAFAHENIKNYRILVMISSWKRPMFLSGQILRFMNQSYDNYKVSVSLKGVDPQWIEKTFMQEWSPFIEKKKLFIRFDINKDQLANQLDPIRDLDLEQYDYFCKIDDDDWYAPTYLEEVNEWLNKKENIDISSTRNMTILENDDPIVNMYYSTSDLSGNTLCLSRRLVKKLLLLEENENAFENSYSSILVNQKRNENEDALIHEFARKIGSITQERYTPRTNIIYGRQYQSITRNYERCTFKDAFSDLFK